MPYVPDNLDLFASYDSEQEARLEELPVCDSCGEYIQDEYCYEINGEILCEECLKELYRKDVADVV